MRRVVAQVLLGIGMLVGSVTLSGWLFRATMLDPTRSSHVARTVLESPEVRQAVAQAIADAAAKAAGQNARDLAPVIDTAMANAPDLNFLADSIARLHAGVIGAGPRRVQFGVEALTPLVGAQLASKIGQVGVDVPEVKPLKSARTQLDNYLGFGLTLTVLLIAGAFIIHPRRPVVFRRIGWWLLSLSLWQIVIVWGIPALVVPKVTDNPWALFAGRVAAAVASQLVPALVGLMVAGFGALIASYAWEGVATAWADDHRTALPGGQPAVGSAAWAAWAASNAAHAEANRRTKPAEPERPASFSASHRRDSGDDRWGL